MKRPAHRRAARYDDIRPKNMSSPFSIIGEAWDFCRRQQAILTAGFWLLFLPMLGAGVLFDFLEKNGPMLESRPELSIVVGLGLLAFHLGIVWGTVCVLHVGKRLLQAKSGRTRSSFKSVRMQAGRSFIPYLLTSILQGIFTMLWSLLLVIPGIVYGVRTVFWPVIVVCEGTAYRAALTQSKALVRGRSWSVFGTILALGLCTFLPAHILGVIFFAMAEGAPPAILLAANIAASMLLSVAIVVYMLSLIVAYGRLQTTSWSN